MFVSIFQALAVRTDSQREDLGLPRGADRARFGDQRSNGRAQRQQPVDGAGVQGHRASSQRVDRAAVLANSLTECFNGVPQAVRIARQYGGKEAHLKLTLGIKIRAIHLLTTRGKKTLAGDITTS